MRFNATLTPAFSTMIWSSMPAETDVFFIISRRKCTDQQKENKNIMAKAKAAIYGYQE
jgi:hypothetical protein